MYKPQRLHPAAMLEFSIKNIYSLLQALLPLLILVLGTPALRKWITYLLPLILALYLVYIVLYWLNYVYYIQNDELRLEYGILVRKKRYISFTRIQTVQLTAGVVQRIFGLVKLQVETAGSGNQAELILPAITWDKANELQQLVQDRRGWIPVQQKETELQIHRLTTSSLFILASTSNSLGVVLAGLLALVSQLDEILPGSNLWQLLATYALQKVPDTSSAIIAGVFLLLLIAWILSLIGNLIKFGGFELIRDGSDLIIRRGLLEKKQITLPLKKIQAVRLMEDIMRLPFGMVSIQAVSISNAGEKGEGTTLMPIISRRQAENFLRETVPEFYIPIEPEKLPFRARGRYILLNIIWSLAIIVPLSLLFTYGYLSFFTLPLAVWLGYLQHRDAGYKLQGNKALIRTRSLGRITTIVTRNKVQSLSISSSYFQRLKLLSSMKLAIASGSIPANTKLIGLETETAHIIGNWYSNR